MASLYGIWGAWSLMANSGRFPCLFLSPFSSQSVLPPKTLAINFNPHSFNPPICSWARHLSSHSSSARIFCWGTLWGADPAWSGLLQKEQKEGGQMGSQRHKIETAWVHVTSLLPLCTCQGGGSSTELIGKANSAFSNREGWFTGALSRGVSAGSFLPYSITQSAAAAPSSPFLQQGIFPAGWSLKPALTGAVQISCFLPNTKKKKQLVTFFFLEDILGELCVWHAAALIRNGGVWGWLSRWGFICT